MRFFIALRGARQGALLLNRLAVAIVGWRCYKVFGQAHSVAAVESGADSRFALSSTAFASLAFLYELAAIIAVSIATGVGYHLVFYDSVGSIENFAVAGSLAGLAFTLTFLIRNEYSIEYVIEGRRSIPRLFAVWSLAFVALGVVGFLTKSSSMFSRGWMISFFTGGYVAVLALNHFLSRFLNMLVVRGLVRRRKVMIVGSAGDIERLDREIAQGGGNFILASRVVLTSDPLEAGKALKGAVANARALGVEDIVLSHSLSNSDLLERSLAAFRLLPAAIHVGAGGLFERFKDARLARFGRITTLSLARAPLGPFEAAWKRAFDMISASFALILLSPLFLVIAVLIKTGSRGPVFFLQRRRGFNLEEFPIWKFRTMTTLDDGDVVRQATANDERVTGIGRLLRKYSLDELPQLINVLKGEMSLVGPRPHAVAHDRFYEQRIALYPRRLNMKPGMTGWAQVNGFRGATETDQDMRNRVEYDLFYIDNWSIAFDIYIIFMTVVSPAVRRNAY